MRFYESAPTLIAEQDLFEKDIKEFIAGNIDPIKFKAIRVAHGVYEQRQEETVRETKERAPQVVASASRSQKTGGSRKVKLTPSQVAIAKKLGVPLEEYAKYV